VDRAPSFAGPAGFGRLLWAEGISNFGSMLSRLAIPWMATLTLQATPWAMAWLLVAQVAAGALAGLLLGPAIDRGTKRAWMRAADAGCASVLLALALATHFERLTMPALVLAAAVVGALATVFDVARSAWVGLEVPAADLPRRNAQLSAVGSLSETVAFAGGGWLFQGLGAVVALAVDALSYAVSAVLLRRVAAGGSPSPQPSPRGRGEGVVVPWWHEARSGWQAVRTDVRLRVLAAIEALTAAAGAVFGACFMVYAVRTLGFEPGVLGVVFALGGLGALAGAAAATRLGVRIGPTRAMAGGLLLAACGMAAPVLALLFGAPQTAATWVWSWALGCLVAQQLVGDTGQVLHEVHNRSLRQSLPPPTLLARVDAALRAVGQAATLAGALAGGALATAWGEAPLLAAAALMVALAAGLALFRLGPMPPASSASAPAAPPPASPPGP
jgi:hypothetical protein